jgi:hypothetical protein
LNVLSGGLEASSGAWKCVMEVSENIYTGIFTAFYKQKNFILNFFTFCGPGSGFNKRPDPYYNTGYIIVPYTVTLRNKKGSLQFCSND